MNLKMVKPKELPSEIPMSLDYVDLTFFHGDQGNDKPLQPAPV